MNASTPTPQMSAATPTLSPATFSGAKDNKNILSQFYYEYTRELINWHTHTERERERERETRYENTTTCPEHWCHPRPLTHLHRWHQNICQTAYFHIRALCHIRKCLTESKAKTVASATVGARPDYCNSLLHTISTITAGPKHSRAGQVS